MIPPITNGVIAPSEYVLQPDETLHIQDQIVSAYGVTLIKLRGPNATPAIQLGSNVKIKGIEVVSGINYGVGEIVVAGNDVVLKDCKVSPGYAGIWIHHGKSIMIQNCEVTQCSHNLYLGKAGESPGVRNVTILGGKYNLSPTNDGIKTLRRCRKIEIIGVECSDNGEDGIDLFAGGREINIVGCTLERNQAQGVDIKTDSINYPPGEWGPIQHIRIRSCEINDNRHSGVKVWRPDDFLNDHTQPRYVEIKGCEIKGNTYYGVVSRADCVLVEGCFFESNQSFGLYFLGISKEVSEGATEHHLLQGGRVLKNTFSGDVVNFNLVDGVEISGNKFIRGEKDFAWSAVSCDAIYDGGNTLEGWGQGEGILLNDSLIINDE